MKVFICNFFIYLLREKEIINELLRNGKKKGFESNADIHNSLDSKLIVKIKNRKLGLKYDFVFYEFNTKRQVTIKNSNNDFLYVSIQYFSIVLD